jgi:hypothetical protein
MGFTMKINLKTEIISLDFEKLPNIGINDILNTIITPFVLHQMRWLENKGNGLSP